MAADNTTFTRLVPGFDFLQSLVKNAGSALPSIGQWIAPTLNPAAEMRLNPVVNSILGAMCGIERTAIAAGVSFPVGGSLLVVARRTS